MIYIYIYIYIVIYNYTILYSRPDLRAASLKRRRAGSAPPSHRKLAQESRACARAQKARRGHGRRGGRGTVNGTLVTRGQSFTLSQLIVPAGSRGSFKN